MKTADIPLYTIVTTEQHLLKDSFPRYTLYLGLGMYAAYFFTTFIYLGLLDQSLVLDKIIWIGTYITPYIVHFWLISAIFILIILFLKDYRQGFRQVKLEPNQITLYPKQKTKKLEILSWEKPIKTIFLAQQKTSFEIDLENQRLTIPYIFYTSGVSKITQFYDAQLINKASIHKTEFQDED